MPELMTKDEADASHAAGRALWDVIAKLHDEGPSSETDPQKRAACIAQMCLQAIMSAAADDITPGQLPKVMLFATGRIAGYVLGQAPSAEQSGAGFDYMSDQVKRGMSDFFAIQRQSEGVH
ncbi:MAG TPA: hypothetical protein VJP88_08750 [Caulobacteraceae bacterium]|nr:hypothetical protein [Caulobacteraceae bacterium]